jgi:hypothetical protein
MKEKEKPSTIKVRFINTYIGKLGTFYKGLIYELPFYLYEKIKRECEEV